jgi:hypothetical protein
MCIPVCVCVCVCMRACLYIRRKLINYNLKNEQSRNSQRFMELEDSLLWPQELALYHIGLMNPFHILTPYLCKICFNIIILSVSFQLKCCMRLSYIPLNSAFFIDLWWRVQKLKFLVPFYPISYYFLPLRFKYSQQSVLKHSQSMFFPSLIGSDIFLSTQFSNNLYLCSSLRVGDEVL